MSAHAVFEATLSQPEVHDLGVGDAALFSCPAPLPERVNEDAAAVLRLAEDTALLVLADGVGGHKNGHQASRVAVETVLRFGAARGGRSMRDLVLDAFEEANREVLALRGAATTLTVAWVEKGAARVCHVGDSQALVCGQRGRLKLFTPAHSVTGRAVQAGLLEPDEALTHEERHVVDNVLGMQDMTLSIGPQVELAPRDTLVIASDGLWDNATPTEVVETARTGSAADAADALRKLAHARMQDASTQPCHPDDLTVLVFQLS